MADLVKMVDWAGSSPWRMRVLNWGLFRVIPFNRPHRLTVTEISKNSVRVKIPFRRSNKNHIKGLHACVMATAAEYATGLLLLYKLGAKTYRLIMQTLEMEYHYQGKMAAYAVFEFSDADLEEFIKKPLESTDKVVLRCEVKVIDAEGNHLCTGYPSWQLKKWDKVKTK